MELCNSKSFEISQADRHGSEVRNVINLWRFPQEIRGISNSHKYAVKNVTERLVGSIISRTVPRLPVICKIESASESKLTYSETLWFHFFKRVQTSAAFKLICTLSCDASLSLLIDRMRLLTNSLQT